MILRTSLGCLLLFLTLCSAASQAGDFYLGVDYYYGQTRVRTDSEGERYDDRFNTSYANLELGYAISPVVSFQLRYGSDLGASSGSDNGTELSLADEFYLGLYNRLDWNMVAGLDFYVLTGLTYNQGQLVIDATGASGGAYRAGFSFGVGLEYEISRHWGVEFEYWLQQTDPAYKVDVVGLGLNYYFR